MKSEYQLCYDRFVITNLCGMDLSLKERALLVQTFFENAQKLYSVLCDRLYLQAAGEAPDQSLWLTPTGLAYLSAYQKAPSDICLMPKEKCPPFETDITEHLELICRVLTDQLTIVC